MSRSRLGCLTGLGILATFITVAVIVGAVIARGGEMFSPGPLNAQAGEMLGGVTSHAETRSQCKACHTAPWELARMADRCVACHTDVGVQMMEIASLHGSISHRNLDLSCGHCHADHRGPDASLTIATSADFPHEALGYSLKGHRFKGTREAFVCSDCHPNGMASFDQAACADCHGQIDLAFTTAHTLGWGGDCLACHDGVDAYGDDFDHNQFGFKLSGRHAPVSCYQCHLDARSVVDLQSTPQGCNSCHFQQDEHAGRFGADCGACHTTDDWEDAIFDHSRSAFPLEGAHAQVDCEGCHQNDQFAGTPTTCVNCHEDPAFHLGQFGTDCAACHSTTAWSPAQFNGRHTFPLNHGESEAVSCATCHPNDFVTYTCYGCHEHTENNIRSEHLEEGISNFTDCMECHPDGREHEGSD